MWIKLDYRFIRPFLSKVLPSWLLVKIYSFFRPIVLKSIRNQNIKATVVHDPFKRWDLSFRNPLGVAAGFDKDGSLLPFLYQLGAGYVVVGTALNLPHGGNPGTPWVPLHASHGALNSLGLPSPGVDRILENIQRFKDQYKPEHFPIGLSVMGHPNQSGQEKEDGILECIEKAQGIVDFIELNQSCPNVGEDLEHLDVPAGALTFDLPIVLKLQAMSPQDKIVELCGQGQINGLTMSNTTKHFDMEDFSSHDQRHAAYFSKKFGGGLSGPALLEPNIQYIAQWKTALSEIDADTILIGCGGIRRPEDVSRYAESCPMMQLYTGVWEAYAKVGPSKAWAYFLQK